MKKILFIMLFIPFVSVGQNRFTKSVREADSIFWTTHENPVKNDIEIMDNYLQQIKLHNMKGTKLTEQFLLDNGFTVMRTFRGKEVKPLIFERNFKKQQHNSDRRMCLWQAINDHTMFLLYDVAVVETEEQVKAIWKYKSGGEDF